MLSSTSEGFELRETHLTAVNETIEDFIASAVTDGSVHIEVLLKRENALLGYNFGVGEEAGSILDTLADTHGERLIFVQEDDVTSAMIRSASVRWDLRVETYETADGLIAKLRRFAGEIMPRDRRGILTRLE